MSCIGFTSSTEAGSLKTVMRSFIMAGGYRVQYTLNPLSIANISSESISFDRIIITFERDKVDPGEVTAQAIYFHPNGTKSTLQSFGGDPPREPKGQQLDKITIKTGREIQLHFIDLLCYATIPGRSPTIITIKLLDGQNQVSNTHRAELPLLSTLPDIANLYRMGQPIDPNNLGTYFEIPHVSNGS